MPNDIRCIRIQAREMLAAHCRAELAAVRCEVHVPATGQAVDASEGCNAYTRVSCCHHS